MRNRFNWRGCLERGSPPPEVEARRLFGQNKGVAGATPSPAAWRAYWKSVMMNFADGAGISSASVRGTTANGQPGRAAPSVWVGS